MDIQVTVKLSLELVNRVAKTEPRLTFDQAVEKILHLGLKAIDGQYDDCYSPPNEEKVNPVEEIKSVQKPPKIVQKLNKSLYPKKSIYEKNQKEFELIFNLLTSFGIGIKKWKDCPDDMDVWELTDMNKNKAGLYLLCGDWRLDSLKFGQPLKGWFEEYQEEYFQDLLINNDCILDDE